MYFCFLCLICNNWMSLIPGCQEAVGSVLGMEALGRAFVYLLFVFLQINYLFSRFGTCEREFSCYMLHLHYSRCEWSPWALDWTPIRVFIFATCSWGLLKFPSLIRLWNWACWVLPPLKGYFAIGMNMNGELHFFLFCTSGVKEKQ